MAGVTSTYAVWELTLACNLGCVHCGSRAGDARERELTTAEALDLVRQMAEAGVAEVTLIGGEAFLRADWLEIMRAVRAAGMGCSMTTGGYGISAGTARAMQAAGVQQVSVDELELVFGQRGLGGECHNKSLMLRNEFRTYSSTTS